MLNKTGTNFDSRTLKHLFAEAMLEFASKEMPETIKKIDWFRAYPFQLEHTKKAA